MLKKVLKIGTVPVFGGLLLLQGILIAPNFAEIRNVWTYNIYYSFAPFYIVFIILLLLIQLHKVQKEPIFYEKITNANPFFYISFFSVIFIFSVSFYINNYFNSIYSDYIFLVLQIPLITVVSILCIKKIYIKLFAQFYFMLLPVIPLPHWKDRGMISSYTGLTEIEKLQLQKSIFIMKYVLAFMFILVLSVFIILVLRRKKSERKNRYKKEIKEKYNELINNYLYDEMDADNVLKQIYPINYPVYLMTVDEILNLVKGEFEDKIIELSKKIKVYDFLIDESNNKKWWKKVKAVYHLGRLKYYGGLTDGFFENIIKDESEDVRAATVVALSYIEDEKSIMILSNLIFDKSSIVREKAKETMIKSAKKSYAVLIELLDNETDESKIILILELLAYIKNYTFISKLDKYINHHNLAIRGAAIEIAGALEYPINPNILKNLLNSNNDFIIKIILKNIYNIADESIIEKIKHLISHKDWDIRYYTAVGLYKLGDKGKTELQNIIKNSKDKFAVDMVKMVIDEMILV